MTIPDRELRLMETFVGLLSDHQKDFEGFVRDVENVRYCHTPIDGQQINRCAVRTAQHGDSPADHSQLHPGRQVRR